MGQQCLIVICCMIRHYGHRQRKEYGQHLPQSLIPRTYKGKPFLYGKMKMLERSQKINTRFSDICLILLFISIPLCQMIRMEILNRPWMMALPFCWYCFMEVTFQDLMFFIWLWNMKTITFKMLMTTSKLPKMTYGRKKWDFC